MRQILVVGSWLLALLAVASVAVLVGGRMVEQTRRVGLLKAVGRHAVARRRRVCCSNTHSSRSALRVWARRRMAGGAVDRLAGAGLLGAPSPPSVSPATVALAVALALGVAIVATVVPAIRAARQSTVAALNDSARAPRRREADLRLSAHLPAPLLLGVRLTAPPTPAAVAQRLQLPVTVSGLVLVMTFHATISTVGSGPRRHPGDHHHLRHAHPPGRRQHHLHRLDDGA